MASFLIDEYNDKQQRDMAKEVSKWSRIIHTGIPHQQNYSDCGVFMVKYADNLVRRYLIQNLTLGHVFQHLLILPFPLLLLERHKMYLASHTKHSCTICGFTSYGNACDVVWVHWYEITLCTEPELHVQFFTGGHTNNPASHGS